jgi:CRP/FNR family cyclic AMP-dependent transcriptional regulator
MTNVRSAIIASDRSFNKKSPSLPVYAHPARRAVCLHRAQVRVIVVVVVPGRDGRISGSNFITQKLQNVSGRKYTRFFNTAIRFKYIHCVICEKCYNIPPAASRNAMRKEEGMAAESVTSSMLCSLPIFSDLSDKHVEALAGISTIRPLADGQVIFHEGDPRDFLYIVLEGRVALEMHVPGRGRLRILTVEPQEVLGWSSVSDAAPKRTMTARGVAAGKLLAIDAVKLHHACQADPVLGYVVMHHVVNVITQRLLATRLQLLDMFSQSSSEAPHG